MHFEYSRTARGFRAVGGCSPGEWYAMGTYTMKRLSVKSQWFFSEAAWPLKAMCIFIRGDAVVILPFFAVLSIIGIFSFRWMMLLLSLFVVFRFLGEMVYWIHQQFGDRTYRPYDFGLKKLDNNAIYILYQLFSLVGMVFGGGAFVYILLRWFGTSV